LVTDPSENAVANARITAKNQATNEQSSATTTQQGNYTIPFLIPGRYTVTVQAPGFKPATRENVEVRVSETVTANFQLELGAVTESVTVTAAPPLVDETTANSGEIMDNTRVTQLRVIGRNPINFTNLTHGVVFNGNQQFQRPFDNGDNINFSINGGLQQTNNFLLDGQPDDAITDTTTDRTHAVNNIALIPTVDAVQEFRVMTNFYDAQYRRTGGGVINITTKSGNNDFHGTAYEFMRRYQLDANNISANAAGIPRYAVSPATHANAGGHTLDQFGRDRRPRPDPTCLQRKGQDLLSVRGRGISRKRAYGDADQRSFGGGTKRRFLGGRLEYLRSVLGAGEPELQCFVAGHSVQSAIYPDSVPG